MHGGGHAHAQTVHSEHSSQLLLFSRIFSASAWPVASTWLLVAWLVLGTLPAQAARRKRSDTAQRVADSNDVVVEDEDWDSSNDEDGACSADIFFLGLAGGLC